MSAKKQSKRCQHTVKGRLCKNYVKEGELCHIHSKKKMGSFDFSSILKQEIKQKYMNNIEEVQQEVLSGKISSELKLKIKNHSDKTGLDEDLIIQSIKTDKVAASHFAKDPLKQNIAEPLQIKIYNEKFNTKIVKLSTNGKNAVWLKDGLLLNKKQETATKSMDGFDEENENYYYCKYTNEKGGAQDNQYKDLIKFVIECNKYCEKNTDKKCFSVLISGSYYTSLKIEQLEKNIKYKDRIKICYL
jgi:hypothetical protein